MCWTAPFLKTERGSGGTVINREEQKVLALYLLVVKVCGRNNQMSDSRQVTEIQGQDLWRRAGGFRTTSSSSSASVSLQIVTLYGGRSSVPVERSTARTLEKSGNKENVKRIIQL